MKSSPKKILPAQHEYLILNQNLSILEISLGAQRFADCPEEVSLGNDVRLSFPELIGVEETLFDILEGRQISFGLRGIARSLEPSYSLYFDLYIRQHSEEDANSPNLANASLSLTGSENRLIVFLKDVTKEMVFKQKVAQQSNEVGLLLSSLAASQKYIDRIITSMADALLVTTASGIIKTVNQAAQNLFKYSQEELLSQPISMLITDEASLQKITSLYASGSGEFLKDLEVVCQTKTGETITVGFSCSAIETDIEGLQNFVYIGRDITERKRAEAEMIKAIEHEKELRELKSRFISMASHEFRNPMTSILSSIELLEIYGDVWTGEKKLKHYERTKAAVKRMTELLEDVLLVSKAEAGKLEFNPTPLLLKDFCTNLVEEIQLSINEKHKINFVYSGQCNKVCMDEKLLLHILINLLTNAIKYSPQNTTVHFGCYCEDKEVTFEVQDEGIGIPPEDQQRLFESFHRAKNVGNIPGTGLGLAIVQKSVELHGGKITLESEVGVGTTFRVTLPLNNESRTG
jgi:PAS domain S-box-containing protein